MKIGETKNVGISKQRDDDNPQLAINIFDCPACGRNGAVATQKWDLTQSMSVQCGSCKSVFAFNNDWRYPVANVRLQNIGVGVKA